MWGGAGLWFGSGGAAEKLFVMGSHFPARLWPCLDERAWNEIAVDYDA